ncbi:hypothetical protein KAU32_01140 [bacterium]|nr:hypothetical protein [bacterium]
MKKNLATTLITIGIIAVAGTVFALSVVLPKMKESKNAEVKEEQIVAKSVASENSENLHTKEIVMDGIEKMDVPIEEINLDEILNQTLKNGIKYTSEVILEAKWGTEPGEINYTAFEGEFYYPSLFVVDGKGHIWFLDTFNNRIQHFDREGKYVTELKVESYKDSFDEAGYKSADVLIEKMFIDDKENFWLYSPEYRIGTCAPKGYSRNGKYLGRKSYKEINKLIEGKEHRFTVKGEIYSIVFTNLTFNNRVLNEKHAIVKKNKKSLKELVFISKNKSEKEIFSNIDDKGYLYLFEQDKGEITIINIHKRTLEGKLKQKYFFGCFIDRYGNIFVLTKLKNPDPRIQTSIGRKIVKWSPTK